MDLRGFRGWSAEYSNGQVIYESQSDWKDIPKNNIITLTLHYDMRQWHIHDKVAYTQKKRASMVPGVEESFQVESRSIGYYDIIDGKNCKVWYTVDENTGKMIMEVNNS